MFCVLVRYVEIGIQEVVTMLISLKVGFCKGVSFTDIMDDCEQLKIFLVTFTARMIHQSYMLSCFGPKFDRKQNKYC